MVAACGLQAGCMHVAEDSSKKWGVRRPALPLSGVEGIDALVIAAGVIEVPLGDRYLNQELWNLVDEQAVPLEAKAGLSANGLRAGLLGSHPPSEFLALLTNEKTCMPPRQIQTRLGQAYSPFPPLKHDLLRFALKDDDLSEEAEFSKAQCLWEVTCTQGEDRRLAVRVVPMVLHGEVLFEPQSVTGSEGVMSWQLSQRQEQERYEGLSVEVDMRPSEFLLIGCTPHADGLLGTSWLTQQRDDGESAVQRLLVIRVARTGKALEAPAPDVPRPLVLQAQQLTNSR